MNLLIFFAIPLATILLAIVLENILENPTLVAITFFSIYLLIAFALFALEVITDLATAIVAIIVYTIIAFITAYIVSLIKCLCERYFNSCLCKKCPNNSNNRGTQRNLLGSNNDIFTGNNLINNNEIITENDLSNNSGILNASNLSNNNVALNTNATNFANTRQMPSGNNNNNGQCNNGGISLTGNIIPNPANGGRTGAIRGCYRRY